MPNRLPARFLVACFPAAVDLPSNPEPFVGSAIRSQRSLPLYGVNFEWNASDQGTGSGWQPRRFSLFIALK
jgi:hypothetical protein